MPEPILLFDYINKVAVQTGRRKSGDKRVVERPPGTAIAAKASGGKPPPLASERP